MPCEVSEEQLWSWIDRGAPELEDHLARCPQCRALAADLRARIQTLEAAAVVEEVRLPQRIGDYVIKGRLGRGGMGVVYEAEQQAPRRSVALKVVGGGGYVTERHVRLFQREAQALALLRHRFIAAIHETGRTEDGQHFFAMELVQGKPLTDYVRSRDPALRDRLELFRKICEGVNYAHQRGVLHRDLKPSNILIDEEGNPKILDFGLARITNTDVTLSVSVTEPGQVMGTLPYMSPEQARGQSEVVDVRSDLYALGVVLYELVTGALPYDVRNMFIPQAVRTVCEQEPRRPSSLDRILDRDIETIILKALAKEPEQRYQSVRELAEDLGRYLADLPILARPPSTVYLLRKFVSRHKLPVALASALLVVTVASAVIAGWLAVRFARERDTAVAAQEVADQTLDFLLKDILSSIDPERTLGSRVTVREVLDQASLRVETEFADRPLLEAAFRETIGQTYHSLGLYENAESHLRAAVTIRRSFAEPQPEPLVHALLELAKTLRERQRHQDADAACREALEHAKGHWGAEHEQVARALTQQGEVRYSMQDFETAERLHRQALGIRREFAGADAAGTAMSLRYLAELYHTVERHAEAQRHYEEALAILNRRGDVRGQARVMNRLANLFRAQGDQAGAERMHRRVQALLREQLGDQHNEVATSLINLAALLRRQSRHREAESLYQEALAIYRHLYGDLHRNVGSALLCLGALCVESRDPIRAEPYLREAVRIWHRTHTEGDWHTAEAETWLGECLTAQGRYEEAEPLLLAGYEVIREHRGADDPRTRRALDRILGLYASWGRPERAARYRGALEGDGDPPAAGPAAPDLGADDPAGRAGPEKRHNPPG